MRSRTSEPRLGKLVLVLIGRLDKTLGASVAVNHSTIKEITYTPGLAKDYEVDLGAKSLETRILGDLGGLSASVRDTSLGAPPPPELARALAQAMDVLESEAFVKVRRAVAAKKIFGISLLGELGRV